MTYIFTLIMNPKMPFIFTLPILLQVCIACFRLIDELCCNMPDIVKLNLSTELKVDIFWKFDLAISLHSKFKGQNLLNETFSDLWQDSNPLPNWQFTILHYFR